MSARRVVLLGCTGSIGRAVVEVIEHLHAATDFRFDVVGLAAGRNAAVLAEQARALGVDHVALADPAGRDELAGIGTVALGPEAALELVESVVRPGDLLVGAMVGSAACPRRSQPSNAGPISRLPTRRRSSPPGRS